MKRLKHIGVDSFSAMRKKILSDYEIAKIKTKDDAAQVDHGNVGESAIRNWLKEFLPKRFDVCKGYIITTNLDYEGPLEEWDIIIYDVLESPILFTRNSGELSETKRAIPIEYVRGVIEVKSVLDPKSAKKAEQKLEKLNSFIGQNKSDNYPIFFQQPFITSMIFFEINLKSFKTYRNALNNIAKIFQDKFKIPFMGALVLKSFKNSDHSGYLQAMIGDIPILEDPVFEMSNSIECLDGKFLVFGTNAYGVNSFPEYVFDLLLFLKGEKTNRVSSFYGKNYENPSCSRLFH